MYELFWRVENTFGKMMMVLIIEQATELKRKRKVVRWKIFLFFSKCEDDKKNKISSIKSKEMNIKTVI